MENRAIKRDRIIERVGNYSTCKAEPEDCQRCHNAAFATIIIDGLCLDCRDEKIPEGLILKQVEQMAEESLSPDGCQALEDAFEELRKNRHIPNS